MADHVETIRRFEQAFVTNDASTIDELCDQALVDHNPVPGQEPTLTGFKQTIAGYKAVFPDLAIDVHAIIAQDDLVATHWTVNGTHSAEMFGVPATGKHISSEGMNFYRVAAGKITDVWTQFDGVGLLQQLGALPA